MFFSEVIPSLFSLTSPNKLCNSANVDRNLHYDDSTPIENSGELFGASIRDKKSALPPS